MRPHQEGEWFRLTMIITGGGGHLGELLMERKQWICSQHSSTAGLFEGLWVKTWQRPFPSCGWPGEGNWEACLSREGLTHQNSLCVLAVHALQGVHPWAWLASFGEENLDSHNFHVKFSTSKMSIVVKSYNIHIPYCTWDPCIFFFMFMFWLAQFYVQIVLLYLFVCLWVYLCIYLWQSYACGVSWRLECLRMPDTYLKGIRTWLYTWSQVTISFLNLWRILGFLLPDSSAYFLPGTIMNLFFI